jgi:hypothetical protein
LIKHLLIFGHLTYPKVDSRNALWFPPASTIV